MKKPEPLTSKDLYPALTVIAFSFLIAIGLFCLGLGMFYNTEL